jgi:molybdate transport system substrate-binding protein
MKRRAVVGVLVLLAVGATGCRWPWQEPQTIRAYIVHHAEGAFKELNRRFERQAGIRVDASYACRRSMYQIMSTNRDGDIYVTSSFENLQKARREGLSEGPIVNAGELLPAIEVARGNPKQITCLADLAKPGVRVCLGHEKACMGRVAKEILEKNKLADKIAPNVALRVAGEHNIAASVDGQKVDATIVWLSTILEAGSDKVEAIAIPPEQNLIEPIGLLVLETGKNKERAKKFAAFVQGPKAKKILAEAGLKRQR